ncbi:MAG: hypothetical protein SNF93_07745 [Rikenellaceae bacterium]
MKKLLSMLLIVAAALTTSCDQIEDALETLLGTGDEVSYSGDLNVSVSGITAYSDEDVEFTIAQNDGSIDLTMKEVKFSESMPVTLTIKTSDVPAADGSFSISTITPTVGGVEMDSYEITNMSGTYDTDGLTVSFECYGCDVTYSGTAE